MSEQLIHLRCSSLPLAFRCPGSVRRGVVPINEAGDAADVGTAAHEGLATMVRTGRVDWDAVPELAKKHGVDEQELRVLLAMGAKLWAAVRASFPNADAEVSLRQQIGSVVLTGHPDVLSAVPGPAGAVGTVGDWKGGRLDSTYREQLLGYCALVLLKHDVLTEVKAGVLWLRDGDYEPHGMTRAGLYEWLARLQAEIVNWDGIYRPGAHCQYCPRSHECAAANALARRDMAVLMDQDLPGHLEDAETVREMREREPDKLVNLVEIARRVQKQAERVISAARDEVIRAGDVVGSEKRLTMQEKTGRQLDAWAAFPVLQEVLDDPEMAEIIDISLAKAEELVAKKAGRGNGAKAKRELIAKLEEVGAITTSTSRALVVRREA
jgi:hypothetical protein